VRITNAVRKSVAALAALLTVLVLSSVPPAHADGTETLGPPSLAIAQGSGIVTGGTGMFTQPSNIDLAISADAAVKQVILYWEGQHRGPAGDATIVVNGQQVVGQLIGGPAFFFGRDVKSSSYRADITSLGLVLPGGNTLTISGMNFDEANNGVGAVVIIDDGSGIADIQVRDGVDLSYLLFPEPRKTTVPQTFTVAAENVERDAVVNVNVGSVAPNRPNVIKLTVGGNTQLIVDQLGSKDGLEWDSLDIPFKIPAGVTTVTVQVLSYDDGSGRQPASLAWVSATLAVEGATDPCTVPSDTPANTDGSAYSLDATALNLRLIDRKGLVRSQAPGQPPESASHFANADVPGLVSAGLLTTQSNSSLDPSKSTASAQVANVSLLNGLVKATAVEAVSQSVAGTDAATYNSKGSRIVGLTVNNSSVTVAPNTKVAVKSLGTTIADLYVYEESGTSTYQGGVSKSSHSVNMLRLVLLKPFLGFPSGTQVIVAHAESDAQSPTIGCPGLKSVSGEAFTAYVDGNLAGKDFVEIKVGDAVLPSTGGSNSDGTNVSIPGVVTSDTATNTTSGSLNDPHPKATSQSVVQSVNVLDGLITADVLNVKCASSANGTNAGTTFETDFLNLKVGKHVIERNPAPNRHLIVPLPGGYASVIINEQVVNGNGTTDTDGTVNALHIRVYTLHGLLEGEIIIASAHCDAHSK
jgi:hypothetical protein